MRDTYATLWTGERLAVSDLSDADIATGIAVIKAGKFRGKLTGKTLEQVLDRLEIEQIARAAK